MTWDFLTVVFYSIKIDSFEWSMNLISIILICSGKAHHSEMLKMLLNNEPPMGFGNKCPKILAYRRLIRMNMPVDDDGNVHFTTTLFALIRESLKIKTLNIQDVDDSEMDRADDDLREVIKKLWPFQDIKQIQLALPPQSGKLIIQI